MPTGYTSQIDEDPKLTTAKWVTEDLTRNFGLLITLRDGPYDLTEDEIEAHLAKSDSTKYYKERLEKTAKTFDRLRDNPDKFWVEEYASTVSRMKTSNKRSKEEAEVTRLRHEQVEADLIKLQANTTDEITRNIAKFGLSQLELVKRDREPYIQEVPTLEKFKEDKVASLNRDTEYYLKQIKEAEDGEVGRVLAYQRIRAEVARILDPHSSAPSANEVKE